MGGVDTPHADLRTRYDRAESCPHGEQQVDAEDDDAAGHPLGAVERIDNRQERERQEQADRGQPDDRAMTLFAQTMSRAEFCRVLERCGYPNDEVEQIAAQLPDPIDVHRDAPILEHYGVTLDHLTDLMGGSPA